MRVARLCFFVSVLFVAGCSSPARESRTFGAGEKATVDQLTYNVIDSEFRTGLGDEPNHRNPQTRFVLIQIAVSNSGNSDEPVPGLALVDDSGKVYPELADGSGVPQWLGVIRKVGPAQTERGTILFDAPAGHYKLRLSEETSAGDVYSDIPLTFVHEQMEHTAPSITPGAVTPQ